MRFSLFLNFQLIFKITILFMSLFYLVGIIHATIFNVFYISQKFIPRYSHIWIIIFKYKIFFLCFTFNMIPSLIFSNLVKLFSSLDLFLHLFTFLYFLLFLNLAVRNYSSFNLSLIIFAQLLRINKIKLIIIQFSYKIIR